MRIHLSIDGNSQFVAMSKIQLRLATGRMFLGKEHFLIRAIQRTPISEPALQCPQLGLAESAWIALIQPLQHCGRLKRSTCVLPQKRLDLFRPHVGERVGPGPPRSLLGLL